MVNYFEILQKLPLFAGVSPGRLKPLLGRIPQRVGRFEKGEILLHQGEAYQELYILLSGSCCGEILAPSGKALIIDEIRAPAILGPAILFSTAGHLPSSVLTRNEGAYLKITKEELLALCQGEPRILNNYLQLLSDKFQFLSRRLSFLSMKTLEEKVLAYLQTLPDQDNGFRKLDRSLEKLATFLAVTRPSLSRVLGRLEEEGKIKRKGRGVKLLS